MEGKCLHSNFSMTIFDTEKLKVGYQKHLNQLHAELAKKARIIQETKKKLRAEQLKVAEMTKSVKSFDFRALKADLEYLQKMHMNNKSTIIDEKVALSTLVNKLQNYVFEVGETSMKENYNDVANQDDVEIEYEIDDTFKSPNKQYANLDDYYIDESESLHLGNSRELEERLKQYAKLQENSPQIESDSNEQVSPLSEHKSNNMSEGSYSQAFLKKKKQNSKVQH